MNKKNDTPNFNYPADVIQSAEEGLKAALESGDGSATIKFLVQTSLAKSLISDDTAQETLERIDSIAAAQADPIVAAILYHFEAKMTAIYLRYNLSIDKRLTLEEATDMKEWSAQQFKERIAALIAKSLADEQALHSASIYSLGEIIQTNENTHLIYPTLLDMLCWNSIQILEEIGSHDTSNLYEKIKSFSSNNPGGYIKACVEQDSDDKDGLKNLYCQFIDETDMAYLAIDAFDNDTPKERYALYTDFLERYPTSIFADDAKNVISYLARHLAKISFSSRITTADSLKVSCKIDNTTQFIIYVYEMPDRIRTMVDYRGNYSKLQMHCSKEVHIEGDIPFSDTVEVEMPPLPLGHYFVFCDIDPQSATPLPEKLKNASKHNLDDFIVTDIALFSASTQKDKARIFAVNANTGKPMKGVKISSPSGRLKTDAQGSVTFKEKDLPKYGRPFTARAMSQGDTLSTIDISRWSTRQQQATTEIEVFTDLGVYHPGDTVHYTAICYTTSPSATMNAVARKKLTVEFYDSNGKTIEETTVITDEMGQIASSFVIPSDRMNGRFTIRVGTTNLFYSWCSGYGRATFQVSDYKTPTFFVETDSRNLYSSGTDIDITGRATTFTGMPVANAKIKASLTAEEWSWWHFLNGSGSQYAGSFDTTTDAEGNFTITIPHDSLESCSSVFNYPQYALAIDVTSPAGETHSAKKIFRTRDFCAIVANMDADFVFCADSGSASLPITVKNSDETAVFDCSYTLMDTKTHDMVASGRFSPENPVIPISSINSGVYKLSVSACDAKLEREATIYRSTDEFPPVASAMWIPQCGRNVDNDNNVKVLVGSTRDESHIYCIATSRNEIIADGWLILKPGMHTLGYKIPKQEYDYLDITLIVTHDGKTETEHLHFDSQYRPGEITVKATAFRNNLIPGEPEKWSFTIEDATGKPVTAEMFCEMYDKAISQIAGNKWSLAPTLSKPNWHTCTVQHIGNESSFFTENSTGICRLHLETKADIGYPMLHTYDIPQSYPPMPRRSRTLFLLGSTDGEMEVYDSYSCAASLHESLDEAGEMPDASAEDILNEVAMRTADIQTALWRPMLRTYAQGNITIEFDAPNFNTTWLMQAIAYTADMHTAAFNAEVTTSKPIMVKANLPRFVRQGDCATLTATLSNATDSTQTCSAVIELFIPGSDEIVASKRFNLTLAPHATEPLSIDWTAPDSIAWIGFRVKAATGKFGDGEQASLVVLPSISPVIETMPFYIEPGESQFSLGLPEFPKGSRVTLEYCNNPVWYCVTALPSVKSDDYVTATGLAHALYALTLAQHIASSNPQIGEAIDYWNSHEGDSTLLSNLEKNSELKIGTLLASPWIGEAERQTLRMKSITELFDSAKNTDEIAKIVKKLGKLQQSDGGWAWIEHYNNKSSFYTTHLVLELIGELRHLGLLKDNKDVNKMLNKAIPYYDSSKLNQFNKRKDKDDYSGLSDFVYVRSLFPDFQADSSTQSLIAGALKAMKTEWEGLSHPDKAYFAVSMYRNGDPKTAHAIIESMRQYAITKPATGMYWDNLQLGWNRFFTKTALTATMLQAFAEIEPDCKDIDLIRKWMLLDKQANDWGNSSLASDAVYALLSSGSKWLGKQGKANIEIAGTKVENSEADQFLGYLKRTVDVDQANGATMTVNRLSKNPAWGAVYCQYAAPMAAIEAASVDELSIEKTTCVVDGNRITTTDTMRVGDRIQTRFVIRTSRDLEFVTLNDERPACAEPVDQLSCYQYLDGVGYFMEIKNDATRLFFTYLPKGTHVITYDQHITAPGEYSVGIATIQSQYAPQITAHSAGRTIKVTK